jgi:hypothetical protein
MNIRLQKLFDTYNLQDKDRYEISQIYQILPPGKRQNLIDNFETIVGNITKLHQDIGLEQEILLGEALSDIESQIGIVHKKRITQETTNDLGQFKKMF